MTIAAGRTSVSEQHPTPAAPAPAPLAVPADFPVRWERADDAQFFWTTDRMHMPDPLTPMDFEFMRDAHLQFSAAFAEYGVPLRYIARLINYRWYFTVVPSVDDPAEIPARMEAGIRAIEGTVPHLQWLWEDEWLPEVQQHLAFWRAFDLQGASLAELMAHHDETLGRYSRVWKLHFLQTFPVYVAMGAFDDLFQDLFGSEGALDSYRLTQGIDNETVRMGRAMWQLSRKALESPVVRAAFDHEDARAILPALARTGDGRAFLAMLDDVLAVYGERGEQLCVSSTSWIEDPTPALMHVREYVRQPEFDFDAEQAALVQAREEALARAREALRAYPAIVAERFEAMLEHAQSATAISEDHNRYIDYGSLYHVRRVLLEIGARLTAAGIIDEPADIFLLTRDEMRAAVPRPDYDLRITIARRKAEIEHFRTVVAPPALGTPPAESPPDDALTRTLGKFFGAPPPAPQGSAQAPVLQGSAGSAGRAVGIARVIASLAEADRVQPGDILITVTTSPAWTPLFATAGGVVTDTGGVLSHCAVVAREYSIPAVVGVGVATALIADGQLVEVDGGAGLVRVIG